MTDLVLTENEVDDFQRLAMKWDSEPRELGTPCVVLCASHRLLQQQVNELEEQVANWKEAFGALDV